MTASPAEAAKLPVWRLISGLGVLAVLAGSLILASLVYLQNFRLDSYMRALAEQANSAQTSDSALTAGILAQAKQLDLPLHPYDIQITRANGRPHIRIEKYTVQTAFGKLDLRMPAAASR